MRACVWGISEVAIDTSQWDGNRRDPDRWRCSLYGCMGTFRWHLIDFFVRHRGEMPVPWPRSWSPPPEPDYETIQRTLGRLF